MSETGMLEQVGDQWRVVFTRRLSHPPDRVWRAITEAEHLAAWFPDKIIGEFAPGAALRFDYGAGTFDGKVITLDPPSVLEILWGDDTLRFELRADGSGTVLVFTDTFGELGKAARDSAGWHVCLDRLGHALDGIAPPTDREHWSGIYLGYTERFGPEASTIGPPGA